jgi:peptide/nickel transport system permease protein
MAATVTAPPETAGPPRRRRSARRLPLKAKVGAAMLALFILIAIIGPAIAPYDPSATTAQAVPAAPNLHHLLGTTSTGQDVLSQLLAGMRSTVVVGLLTGVIATSLAVIVGVSAGYLGGARDEGLSLLMNVFLILPALPLLIILLGYLPASTGELSVAIVLSALGWPWGARVIRAQTLTLRNREFVAAARETGERNWRIIAFEILPNEVSLIAANFVGTVLYAILTSVALAFIGVAGFSGWSLGTILYWAQSQGAFSVGAWWWYVPPGVAAALLGMSLVLLNFGLDELGNPRLRNADAGRRRRQPRWRPTDPTPVERSSEVAA